MSAVPLESAGVGWTALVTAHARAVESERPDALCDDPLARSIVEALGLRENPLAVSGLPTGPAKGVEVTGLWALMRDLLAVRTVSFDDVIQEGVGAGVRQVVLLGAGLDTRAFRLGLSADTTVFEVDVAPVFEAKEYWVGRAEITPACRRVTVAADLRGEEWTATLYEHGFDPRLPSVWVAEGLLYYLPSPVCDRILDLLTALSPPGSRLALDYLSNIPDESAMVLTDEHENAVWKGFIGAFTRQRPRSLKDWLGSAGWTSTATSVGAEIRRHGREVPRALRPDVPGSSEIWLTSGTNRPDAATAS